MTDPAGPRARAALALAAALAVWPYLSTLGHGPMALDSVFWLVRGSPDSEGWWHWALGSAHFIGYRPVGALSFTLLGAAGDGTPIQRCFDLALHVVNGLLIFAVARRAVRLPAWAALLAACTFLWHPVTEDVVPWLARRHYALATAFSLGTLLLLGGGRPSRGRALAAGGCLGAALLSNEVAYVTALALPAWAWATAARGPRRGRDALLACLPAAAVGALALGIRTLVLGGMGGYPAAAGPERIAQVIAAFWRDLVAFAPVYGAQPEQPRLALLGLAALGVGTLGLRSLAAARAGRPDGVLGLVLGGWLVAASVLLATQHVWFSRELYPFVPIFALWLAVVCRDIASHATGGARAAWLAPPGALLLVLALHSPVLQGPDALRLARWQETQAVLEELGGELARADEPLFVGLVLPYREDLERRNPLRPRATPTGPPRWLRIPAVWLGARFAERGHDVQTLVLLPTPAGTAPEVRLGNDGTELRVPRQPAPKVLTTPPLPAQPQGEALALSLAPLLQVIEEKPLLYVRGDAGASLLPLGGPDPGRPSGAVLIVIDTLRRDHLGTYGYGRNTSPQLDRFAEESVRYTQARSQAPWTTPSVASLLTSRYPQELGVTGVSSVLSEEAILLSERLRAAGFATGAVVSHRFSSARWGFDQGFDSFDDSNALGHDAVTSPDVTDKALAFLDAHRNDPFFLWVHYFDPHFAYREHEGFEFPRESPYSGPVQPGVRFGELLRRQALLTPGDARELERLYDSEISFTDKHVGRILSRLRELGIDSRTLVVITADHGEEFLDHGRLGHTKTLYDEVIAVPLLVRWPGGAPGVVAEPVALLDVAPTILAALEVPADPGAEGHPLPGPGAAGDPDRIFFSATDRPEAKRAAIGAGFKLIADADGNLELYALEDDPEERRDLAAQGGQALQRLSAALEDFETRTDTPANPGSLDLSDSEREALRALGYETAAPN